MTCTIYILAPDITAMVSAYVENDRLSEAELDTLRALLSQKKE